MNLIKRIGIIAMIFTMVMACKEEKKEASEAEETVEAVQEAESTENDTKDAAETEVAVDEPETTDESSAEVKEEQPKAIGVYYPKDTKLANEVDKAIKRLIEAHPEIKKHFYNAHGFVVFPIITKAAIGVGGAGGKGLVFNHGKVIGSAKIAQATIGLQAGGQQYQEIIFFEDKAALDRFKSGKVKFSGQASAVMLKDGVSADIDYQDGVAIFTKAKGGVMAEASIGGQKFKYHDGIK